MVKKCGYVTILGIPNVGKSTLTNYLVGSKVSIVSSKVQTTRRRIIGIVQRNEKQIILVDTPGIFIPRKRLDRAMVSAAWEGTFDADVVIVMADASHKNHDSTKDILNKALQRKFPVILVINKIDLLHREKLLAMIEDITKDREIEKVFLISANSGSGVEDLVDELASRMPDGPWLFPDDQISDLPLRLWAAEMTREKIFRSLHQELPYAMTVETETWEDFKNGEIKISQVIHVQKDSQKRILLGKNGQQIKFIRESAAKEISMILGSPIHLFLHVIVTENWQDKAVHFTAMGLDFKS